MKSNKQLDEMQESKLLKIQEKGFWLVFWVLFAAIFVQALIGMTLKEIAGEIVVLVAASIYIAAASLKNGLWTRNIQPTIKSNLATSIIPALILGVFGQYAPLLYWINPFQKAPCRLLLRFFLPMWSVF